MLLKSGYRHVYISRKFAIKHGFTPPDAAPGHYGYGGLLSIGKWPITLIPSSTQPGQPAPGYQRPDAFFLSHSTSSSPSHDHTRRASSRMSASPMPPSSRLVPPLTNSRNGSIRSLEGSPKHLKRREQTQTPPPNNEPKAVEIEVYLSEEPHFDVVLGRSFFEKRQIKTTSVDPTDVVCLDTGEKIECELVILKDGRGEIVTVT